MSFRRRLTLFFLLIVIVPMVAVGVVVFRLVADNETGKADSRLAQGQQTARFLYSEAVDKATKSLRRVDSDAPLAAAVRAGNSKVANQRASTLLDSLGLQRLVIRSRGKLIVDVGDERAIAMAEGVSRLGRLQGSSITAAEYATRVRALTDLDMVVSQERNPVATTLGGLERRSLPRVGDLTVNGRKYRVATVNAPSFSGRPVQIAVLAAATRTSSAISSARVVVGLVLAGFLLLAFAFALAVSRALQGQIAGLLEGARRLGSGDFSTPVPIDGHDEFAALGGEFNKMSQQLEARLEELRQERARLEDSIRRVGQTFASSLDREGLLEIVVRTAADALGAGYGRASVREADGRLREQTSAGQVSGFEEAIYAVESAALASRQPEEAPTEDFDALAFPLTRASDPGFVLGLVSIARRGQHFSSTERELFAYLAAQAAVSIENVGLHEMVAMQAVTDELTGLFNHRRFQEVIATEVERAKRFEQVLALLLLDIDDFKKVNDNYGHQQGDLVLQEVARIVRESSREIDEPARYGGEELAVALPQTDLEGAYNLAERMRSAIEQLAVRRVDGDGTIGIRASFGVAAIPDCAGDKDTLIAAADAALYEAKRAGKNRTERAPVEVPPTVPAE
jgi:diguanylate cyclase (GGDEF)-like protein